MIIAIDGPAASGKGTIAKKIAEHYQLSYLDTGKLYREVALRMLKDYVSIENETMALMITKNLDINAIDFENENLIGELVGKLASQIAVNPKIRKTLLEKQREFAKNSSGIVVDGRDIGTVVLPDADKKLFVTASAKVRARRRYLELKNLNKIGQSEEEILEAIKARDDKDENREISPLKPADDAIILDTSKLDIEKSFEKALELLK